MTKKFQHTNILPARFRLRSDVLENIGVHVYSSSWLAEANSLARQLESGAEKKAKIRLFNQVVLALSPVLVHGFKPTGFIGNGQAYQMLALDQYPGQALITSLARHWADVWLETSYSHIAHQHLMRNTQHLFDLIDEPGEGWVEKNALEALKDNRDSIRYSALPSLIAAQFAASGPSEINGHTIRWGLTQQEDSALAVVSDPQPTKTGATFAYLIRFSLQYQPGNLEPWIHTSLTCQRYMDEALESGNKNRNATILLRLGRPLHMQWIHNQTLVRLPVWNVYGKTTGAKGQPKFPDGFHSLLDRAQAREIIRTPSVILDDPNHYRRNDDDDSYYVLFAEGYDPAHKLGSGFGARERTEVFRNLADRLNDMLIPGNAIPLFRGCIESRALAPWKMTEDKAPTEPPQKREIRLNALLSATGDRPVRVLLASHSPDMGKAMRYFLEHRYFRLDSGERMPEQFQVQEIEIPDGLFRPLEISDQTDSKKSEKRADAEQKFAVEWQQFLHQYKGSDQERLLAWIELPDSSDFSSTHNAIRMACVKEGIASQMIRKLRSKYEYLTDMGRFRGVATAMYDFGRLYNACGDLLLRQTGVARGDTRKSTLPQDYETAGFSPEVARQLVVVGLTIFRTNRDNYRGVGSVNFPVAVRILPGGRVEAKIPDVCDWDDYFDASIALGNVFIKSRRKTSFTIDSARVFGFIQGILAEHRELPTLILLDASKLRYVWKNLKVDDLTKGKLMFGGDSYESISFPNMNVVWIRQHGEDETPQYVATSEYSWHDADDVDRIAHTSLFADSDAHSNFQPYFSVGRLDNNKKADQKAMRREDGEEMNFRNQQMLEMVPVMGYDAEASVVVAHLLRSSPAWSIGNTVLPYPIHLANKMIEDMLPLLGVEDSES